MPSKAGSTKLAQAEPGSLARHESDATERTNLERRYQRIGIPAVAAAARYHVAGRNPAYAPASPSPLRFEAVD